MRFGVRSHPKDFEAKITPIDCNWTPDSDDEQVLYETLNGKSWADVPHQFVNDHPGEIVLLTTEAFAAFLPAWLECALDALESENAVREYLVYTFSPRHDFVPDTTITSEARVPSLSQRQQRTLRSLMDVFAQHDPSPFVRAHAAKAVALIDELTNGATHRLHR